MNNCIKPVQFLYTTWGICLCTCYILPHSGNESYQGGLWWEIADYQGGKKDAHVFISYTCSICWRVQGWEWWSRCMYERQPGAATAVLNDVCPVPSRVDLTSDRISPTFLVPFVVRCSDPDSFFIFSRFHMWSSYKLMWCLVKETCQGVFTAGAMTDGVLEKMTMKDVERGILLTTAREEDWEVISGWIKGFISCSMLYWGGTAPVHKMTLDTSPELMECARCPPPANHPTVQAGNPLKTESSILESSLILRGKRYDHIYKLG